jgi:ABC transport system ATP-binding/permease protein
MGRALSCEAVSKVCGPWLLLHELSFGLRDGDQAGLAGPNGSGKSTLLKILAGIETPDRGTRSVRSGVRIGYVRRAGFADGRAAVDTLPGGWRKGPAIACALVAAPDILLMDEPTNEGRARSPRRVPARIRTRKETIPCRPLTPMTS